jgi:hypothetical protein
MKLSISCDGGHTKPTIGGRGDDHAICDLINELRIPVARVGDPKPGVAFEGDVVRILSME